MRAQRAKQYLLDHATQLPTWLASGLMALNRDPVRIYGRAYAAFRERLQATAGGYDNTADVLRAVNAALVRISYYRDRYGAAPVASLEELRSRIGFLDRGDVVAAGDALADPDLDRDQYDVCSTGGTSGAPLQFLAPKTRFVVEYATMHSLWAQAGYAFHPRAVIRNHRSPARSSSTGFGSIAIRSGASSARSGASGFGSSTAIRHTPTRSHAGCSSSACRAQASRFFPARRTSIRISARRSSSASAHASIAGTATARSWCSPATARARTTITSNRCTASSS
jgi:hypothetical protein